MKKFALILSVMLMSMAALTACDADKPAGDTETAAATETEVVGTTAGTETETEAATEAATKVTYTVTVVDQDGNPVANVRVQMCKDELCMLPKSTDENGVATFSEDPATYRAKLASLPEGYTADMDAYHPFADDATEVTITVTKG